MSRLQRETGRILAMSVLLQSHIQALCLSDCDAKSRKPLQTADALTQSLQCIDSALAELADASINIGQADLSSAVSKVFLEDIRMRLVHGSDAPAPKPAEATGKVELF